WTLLSFFNAAPSNYFDSRRPCGRQCDLCTLRGVTHAHQCRRISAEIDCCGVGELPDAVINDRAVEVSTAEPCIAVHPHHFEDTFSRSDERHIERASTQVVHERLAVVRMRDTNAEARGDWFWNHSHDLESRERRGLHQRVIFALVEVRRSGDDRTSHP